MERSRYTKKELKVFMRKQRGIYVVNDHAGGDDDNMQYNTQYGTQYSIEYNTGSDTQYNVRPELDTAGMTQGISGYKYDERTSAGRAITIFS